MKELSSDDFIKLRNIELNMLNDIDKIFKENNIRYVAMFGTLLGAIRHNGFIPWDDDIDIGVPRRDYEYLIDHFYDMFPQKYGLITPSNCVHHEYLFSKIHNKETTFIEIGVSEYPDRYSGVFVDVFPLDGAPDNKKEQKKYKETIKKYSLFNSKIRFNSKYGKTAKSKFAYVAFSPLRMMLKYDFFYKKYIDFVKKYDFDSSEYFSYPSTDLNYDFIFSKKYIGKVVYTKFENTNIMVPIGAKEILHQTYGEYMELPPKEKQVPMHLVECIDLERPYKIYLNKLNYKKK